MRKYFRVLKINVLISEQSKLRNYKRKQKKSFLSIKLVYKMATQL